MHLDRTDFTVISLSVQRHTSSEALQRAAFLSELHVSVERTNKQGEQCVVLQERKVRSTLYNTV